MKIFIVILCSIIASNSLFGQTAPSEYYLYIEKADSLYNEKDYKNSASMYSEAFKVFGWRGFINDRYNAACSWALANFPDSAFFQLTRIATKANYTDYEQIISDPNFKSLYNDKRWISLLEIIQLNKYKAEANLDSSRVLQLDSIYNDDQKYRLMLDSIEKFGENRSEEINELWKVINKRDSLNLIKVTYILDNYGWLGPDVVGVTGNETFFLVIQHSDIETQEKYKLLMENAVRNGKASASSFALLTDRIEMGNKRPQIYGSQVQGNRSKGYKVYKIKDEINVNKRRAEVGLEPLEEYLKNWNIVYKLSEK
jgi:hypothetical protein